MVERSIINLIGPEGSGKSTLARRLSTHLDKPFFSTGDKLRELARDDQTYIGDACREMFKKDGYMIPEVLLSILESEFRSSIYEYGFVLDGGLRTVGETVGYWEMLKCAGRLMSMTVIRLHVPGWLGALRLLSTKRENRKPDTVDSVLKRMNNYYYQVGQRTQIIRSQENCRLITVSAVRDIDKTFARVCEVLE